MDSPWKEIAPVDASREHLALFTYLPLRKRRHVPLFFWFTLQIQRQLARAGGIIGYSLRAKPLQRNFWTLSVWQDDRALMDFMAQLPHSRVMKSLSPHMGATKFTRWKLLGSATPPKLDDAIRRSQQEA